MNRNKQSVVRAYARVATREQIKGISEHAENCNAYVYARVGGGSSSLPGTDIARITLEAQCDRLRECAESMGLKVVEKEAEFARIGISESSMQKMLKAAESGMIGTLVIAGCNRLHRNSEKAIDLLSELDHYGVRIYSQQEGWVNVSEEGQPSMLQFLQMMRSTDRKEGALNELS